MHCPQCPSHVIAELSAISGCFKIYKILPSVDQPGQTRSSPRLSIDEEEVARWKNAISSSRAEPGQYIQELQLIVRASLPPELRCAVHVNCELYIMPTTLRLHTWVGRVWSPRGGISTLVARGLLCAIFLSPHALLKIRFIGHPSSLLSNLQIFSTMISAI